MEEQHTKTKIPAGKGRRTIIMLFGVVVFVAAVVAVTLLANRDSNDQKSPATVKVAVVRITQQGFQPATVTVEQGTKVTWINDDANLHQVAANPYPKSTDLPRLKSEILNNAQTYVYTADTVGTFGYHDQLNPTINGTLVVQKQ
jgi:plastocyanin